MTILDSRITIPFIKVGAAGKGVALLLDTLPWMREWEEKSQVNYESDCFESVHQCCRFTLTRDLLLIDPPQGPPWLPPWCVPGLGLGWCIVSRCSKLDQGGGRRDPPHSSSAGLTSSFPCFFFQPDEHWALAASETQYKDDEQVGGCH